MPHAKSIHVIGIGGVGMSAIAQGYLDAGFEVTGSDRFSDTGDTIPAIEALRRQGVRIFPQDGSGVSEATTFVAASTAIEADNPDLAEARRLNVETVHRSVALERLAAGRTQVAVAGTSGKSTTTALLGWILESAGLDPTVVNGAAIVGWDRDGSRVGSVRHGEGPLFVFEADESDRSFLRYSPDAAIVTNETADHFPEDETHALFAEFKGKVKGPVVEGLPDDFAVLPSPSPWKSRFRSGGREWSVSLPGAHNCMNASQALRLALTLGVPEMKVRKALLTFPGVERRLQRVGKTPEGTLVVDDYGHNPAKLSAAMRTISAHAAGLAVLWRPHGYAPLRKMLQPLAEAFAANLRPDDRLFLLPVFDAGGTADRTISTGDLVRAISGLGFKGVSEVADIGEAKSALQAFSASAGQPAAILVCGARDPALPRLARELASQ